MSLSATGRPRPEARQSEPSRQGENLTSRIASGDVESSYNRSEPALRKSTTSSLEDTIDPTTNSSKRISNKVVGFMTAGELGSDMKSGDTEDGFAYSHANGATTDAKGGSITSGLSGNTTRDPLVIRTDIEYVHTLQRNYAAVSHLCVRQQQATQQLRGLIEDLRQKVREKTFSAEKLQDAEMKVAEAREEIAELKRKLYTSDSAKETLKLNLDHATSQMRNLSQSNSENANRLSHLQQQLKLREEELTRLKGMSRTDALKEEMNRIKHELEAVSNQLEKSERERERLTGELKEKMGEVVKSYNIQRREKMEKDNAVADVARLKRDLEKQNESMNKMRRDMDDLRSAIEAKDDEIRRLERHLLEVREGEGERLRDFLAHQVLQHGGGGTGGGNDGNTVPSTTSKSDLKDTNRDDLKHEYAILKAQFETLWEEKTQLEDSHRTIAATVAKTKSDLEDALKRESVQREITLQLTQQAGELSQQVGELMAERDSFLERVAFAQNAAENAGKELAAAKVHEEQAVRAVAILEAGKAELEAICTRLRREAEERDVAETRSKQVVGEIAGLRDKMNRFNQDNAQLEEEKKVLLTKIDELKSELLRTREEKRLMEEIDEMRRNSAAISMTTTQQLNSSNKAAMELEIEKEVAKRLDRAREEERRRVKEEMQKTVDNMGHEGDWRMRQRVAELEEQLNNMNKDMLRLSRERNELAAVVNMANR